MLALAARGEADGAWIVADRQSGGRGRMGRAWQSPEGNFHGSTLIRLRAGDPVAATLAVAAAVAVFDACACWVAPQRLTIKWPNDLLADGAKLCGILLERSADAVIVGIGVNLAVHPDDAGQPATSFAGLGAPVPSNVEMREALGAQMAIWLAVWREGRLAAVRDAWLARAHAIGTPLVANLPDGSSVAGRFDGLTEDCALRLCLADGGNRVIHAGDVIQL